MDDIKQRLQQTSETCFQCYEAWSKDQKSVPAREALVEAIHELRKVASRLEIELAVSERNEMGQKPLPIPPHRDARGRGGRDESGDDDDGRYNNNQGESGGGGGSRAPQRRGGPKRGGAPSGQGSSPQRPESAGGTLSLGGEAE